MATIAFKQKTFFLVFAAAAAFTLTRVLIDLLRPMEKARLHFAETSFSVEVAKTNAQLRKGLQNRPHLEAEKGMLFSFPSGRAAQFWMKDTLIPLDIVWMDADFTVIHLEESVPPCEVEPCPLYGPKDGVSYTLEINAGAAMRAGIGIGDQARYTEIDD